MATCTASLMARASTLQSIRDHHPRYTSNDKTTMEISNTPSFINRPRLFIKTRINIALYPPFIRRLPHSLIIMKINHPHLISLDFKSVMSYVISLSSSTIIPNQIFLVIPQDPNQNYSSPCIPLIFFPIIRNLHKKEESIF